MTIDGFGFWIYTKHMVRNDYTHKNNDPYNALAMAIIRQAVIDYKKYAKVVQSYKGKTFPNGIKPKRLVMAEELYNSSLEFFRDDWISFYSDLNGKYILEKLNEQVW